MSHPRHLSLFVEGSDPGHFHWVIESAQDGTVWKDIKSSEQSYTSWNQAFDYGNVALTTLIDDAERSEPCAPGEGATGAAQVGLNQ